MRKFKSIPQNLAYLAFRWIQPFFNPIELFSAFPRYIRYFGDWFRYSRMDGAESIRFSETFPCIHDRKPSTRFARHYFYQDIWAYRKIAASGTDSHVDVGSRVDYIGLLTAVTRVTFIDIRPLEAALENLESKKGSILAMPYEDGSIHSLSCLHVAEHIGLGRYGDPLDPRGTLKACRELSRVLAPGGNLYFSLPVGKPRLCFNGHRIHSPGQILEYFSGLRLVELSGINDEEVYIQNIDRMVLENADYGCGLFHFTRE